MMRSGPSAGTTRCVRDGLGGRQGLDEARHVRLRRVGDAKPVHHGTWHATSPGELVNTMRGRPERSTGFSRQASPAAVEAG